MLRQLRPIAVTADDRSWHETAVLGVPTRQAQRDSRRGLLTSPESGTTTIAKMTRTELIIQLLKVAIGLAFGAYFVWWSLQVLDRLTPEYDARTTVVARAS